jgi:hypothetical protein
MEKVNKRNCTKCSHKVVRLKEELRECEAKLEGIYKLSFWGRLVRVFKEYK